LLQAAFDVRAEKKVRVAINGFGRIGRNFLRCWEGRKDSLLDVVAINDSGGVKQASHLLKYDSTLGVFGADVKIIDNEHISVNGKSIKVVSSRDPLSLPWKEMEIDLVIEGTGVFVDSAGAGKHIQVRLPTEWLPGLLPSSGCVLQILWYWEYRECFDWHLSTP
jgi:glyceraldehyde-3-phosphate dehydrogenase (NADP+) (phosphorylating)